MGYYENKVPPARENRMHVDMAYGGNVRELRRRAAAGCEGNRRFCQANACQLMLTMQMAFTIPDAVVVVHGPVGCGSQSHTSDFGVRSASAARGAPRERLIWVSSNLKNDDVIAGGAEKLVEAVVGADRAFAPKLIFVASTCTPSVIGDDIDEILERIKGDVAARIVPLHCPGFKTKVVASAYDTFYHGIIGHLDFDPVPYVDYEPLNPFAPDFEIREAQFHFMKRNTVNLLNASSFGAPDEAEIVRLLKALDLNVRVYTEYTPVDDFRKITLAGLNVSMCNVHDDYLALYLEEKYDMPYLIHSMPLGIAATGEWLLAVAERFGREEAARRLIEAEERCLSAALAPLRESLRGKRAIVNGGVIRVAQLALMLSELEMEVVNVRAYHYDDFSDDAYRRLEELLPDTEVNVAPGQISEFVNILKREKPDLCISHGGTNAWVTKTGVPSVPLFSPAHCYFGYKGVFEQARHFRKLLANTAFPRVIAENTRLPYRPDWYGQDAYRHIDGGSPDEAAAANLSVAAQG
jgi:nitrogenase molybdenum-iron protein alpha chain